MKGQTLIEVLVALGIITVVITAISSVVITSQGNMRYSRDQNLATQYAQEGLEIIRQIRDNGYETFRSYSGTKCLGTDFIPANNCNNANVGNFLRKVTFTPNGCSQDVSLVEVSVYWRDSKCPAVNPFCHSSLMSTCLNANYPVRSF